MWRVTAASAWLCVLCATAATATRQQDSFYFDPAPVSQDVAEGAPVRLRCDVSNRHQIAFYWTLDGKPVANTSRRWQDGADLRVASVDRDLDAGSLRCIATNVTTGIALRSAAARLNILCKHHHHTHTHTHTHTHSFNGPFSGTTQVSRYQKC